MLGMEIYLIKIQQNVKKNKKENKNNLDSNFFNGGSGHGGVYLIAANTSFLEKTKWKI
ncbi:MAG: hypothetical protein PHQ20_03280 [Candidatus Moranbacteria bacterium]|jgi:hypothetical protein|nr:hypothetical protein [Candidatus Moranbacteria bacterium]